MISQVRLTAYKILYKIIIYNNKSKLVIDKYIDANTLYKNQINNLVYGVLRYYFIFEAYLNANAKKQALKKAKIIFYMAFYELLFNDASKFYVVKSEYLNFLDKLKLSNYKPLLYAILVKLNLDEISVLLKNIKNIYPSFFISYLEAIEGLDIDKYLNNLITKPCFGVYFIDVNIINSIEHEYDLKVFNKDFYYTYNSNILNSTYLKEGRVYIQDLASQIPASLLDYDSNIKVLDLCSAPGGKTINIASNLIKVNNTNKLISVEKSKDKFNILKNNIKNFTNIELINDDLFNLNYNEIFDYVLVDAPCSALGTVKRHPEVLINYKESNIFDFQYSILEKSATFVKKGSFLIYSVCTFNLAETKDIVAKFLINNSDFSLVSLDSINKRLFNTNFYINTAFYNDIMDTHFIVKLKKKG